IAYWQGDYESVRQPYEEAAEIAREVRDHTLLASALHDLSYVPLLSGEFDRTERLLDEALAEAPEDNRERRAQISASRAYLRAVRGDPAGAIPLLEGAVAEHRDLGLPARTAEYLIGIAAALRFS